MSHIVRDPDTGQFVDVEEAEPRSIEVVNFEATTGVTAANLGGATSFTGTREDWNGLELIDYDDVIDRDEVAVLMEASHMLNVFTNPTQTADGFVMAAAAPMTQEALSDAVILQAPSQPLTGDVLADTSVDDTIDVVGRPLMTGTGAQFSDGATGVGGSAAAGTDDYQSDLWPDIIGFFHPRDELFYNGTFRWWNISDSGIHSQIVGQHKYAVFDRDIF